MRKIKLLVVDDSMLFREVLSRYIREDTEIDVVGTAGDAYSARDMILKFEPDVMTLDIEMPKMDGHHLTKQIKDDPVLKSIPVYLFSSLINDQMRIKGESVGADGQFSKPQIGQLIQYLNEHI